MKQIVRHLCAALTVAFLLGLLAACGGQSGRKKETAPAAESQQGFDAALDPAKPGEEITAGSGIGSDPAETQTEADPAGSTETMEETTAPQKSDPVDLPELPI